MTAPGDRQICGRSVVLRPEDVFTYVERKDTAVEKDHLMENFEEIQP